MSHTAASLADGQVAASWAAIYTVPASTVALLKNVYVYNTGSSVETVEVGITRSGGSRRQVRQFQLGADESGELNNITLSAGDTLDAQTSTVSTVDYTITGTTE